jgi:hypothetical protein
MTLFRDPQSLGIVVADVDDHELEMGMRPRPLRVLVKLGPRGVPVMHLEFHEQAIEDRRAYLRDFSLTTRRRASVVRARDRNAGTPL